jgi:hypothetical protein
MGFVCTANDETRSEIALIGDSVVIPIGYDDVEPTQERAMSPKNETERMLESSQDRRNGRIDALLKDPKVKAAIQRDQRPKAR